MSEVEVCLIPRRPALHDNSNIDVRSRALWAEVLAALESRVASVNTYVPERRSHIVCTPLDAETIHLQHASSERSVLASLDLKKHAIHLKEFSDLKMQFPKEPKDMPLSMLADGELYVTDGNELKANAMEVAKSLLQILFGEKYQQNVSPEWLLTLDTPVLRCQPRDGGPIHIFAVVRDRREHLVMQQTR